MILNTDRALDIAKSRRLRPTALSSAEIRDQWKGDVKRRSYFSARTVQADYLAYQHLQIQRLMAGEITQPQFRLLCQAFLRSIGYDSEKVDLPNRIPPATRGTLRDLASAQRLDLIATTQWGILTGQARRMAETDPQRIRLFPAWMLVRFEGRATPRGFVRRGGALVPAPGDWEQRWIEAGGPPPKNGILIAWKWDLIWINLGNSKLFKDGLSTEFTPYWFSSGAGLQEKTRAVAERHLGPMPWLKGGEPPNDVILPRNVVTAPARVTVKDWPANVLKKAQKDLAGVASPTEDGLDFKPLLKQNEEYAKRAAERLRDVRRRLGGDPEEMDARKIKRRGKKA